jgi:hypothetical protein
LLQRYRLRLADGTVLQVDKDGLHAWLEDGRAAVQVAGTQQWRPLREFLAEEESAARVARALIPPEPRRAPAPFSPEVPAPSPPFEPAIGEPPVQSLAEEPSAPTPPWQAPPEAPVIAEGPAIRLKPLEDEPHARGDEADAVIEDEAQDPYAVPRPRAYEFAAEEEEEERHDRLEGPLLQVVTAFGTLLSRSLDPLTPLVRRWQSQLGSERPPRGASRSLSPPRTPPAVEPPPPASPPPAVEPPVWEPTPARKPPEVWEPPPPVEPLPPWEPPPAAAPPQHVSVLAEDPGRAAESR